MCQCWPYRHPTLLSCRKLTSRMLAVSLKLGLALSPYGEVSFATVEGEPAIIPDEELEALKIMVASEIRHNPYPYLKAGRKIRVKYSPLEGCEGVLVRKRGLTRLVVTVHLLQRSIETEVDAAWIEPR